VCPCRVYRLPAWVRACGGEGVAAAVLAASGECGRAERAAVRSPVRSAACFSAPRPPARNATQSGASASSGATFERDPLAPPKFAPIDVKQVIGRDKLQFSSPGAARTARFSTNYQANLKEKSTFPQSLRAYREACSICRWCGLLSAEGNSWYFYLLSLRGEAMLTKMQIQITSIESRLIPVRRANGRRLGRGIQPRHRDPMAKCRDVRNRGLIVNVDPTNTIGTVVTAVGAIGGIILMALGGDGNEIALQKTPKWSEPVQIGPGNELGEHSVGYFAWRIRQRRNRLGKIAERRPDILTREVRGTSRNVMVPSRIRVLDGNVNRRSPWL
jgi:hypothetical protein